MGSQIIEVAIRSPKAGVSREDFLAAKDAAVQKLVSLKGIGPEREFRPFLTVPEPTGEVFVGMTRYATKGRSYGAMMNFGFMMRLMAFMKRMEMHAGVLLSPDDEAFDYLAFTSVGNVVEISLLRPRDGIQAESFTSARATYLSELAKQDDVAGAYTFGVAGGFKLTDTHAHMVVYRDRAGFDRVGSRIAAMPEFATFKETFDVAQIVYTETTK